MYFIAVILILAYVLRNNIKARYASYNAHSEIQRQRDLLAQYEKKLKSKKDAVEAECKKNIATCIQSAKANIGIGDIMSEISHIRKGLADISKDLALKESVRTAPFADEEHKVFSDYMQTVITQLAVLAKRVDAVGGDVGAIAADDDALDAAVVAVV